MVTRQSTCLQLPLLRSVLCWYCDLQLDACHQSCAANFDQRRAVCCADDSQANADLPAAFVSCCVHAGHVLLHIWMEASMTDLALPSGRPSGRTPSVTNLLKNSAGYRRWNASACRLSPSATAATAIDTAASDPHGGCGFHRLARRKQEAQSNTWRRGKVRQCMPSSDWADVPPDLLPLVATGLSDDEIQCCR